MEAELLWSLLVTKELQIAIHANSHRLQQKWKLGEMDLICTITKIAKVANAKKGTIRGQQTQLW